MFRNFKILHLDATPEALDFLKLWVFGIWLFIVATDPLTALARIPPAYLQPVGILQWLPSKLSHGLLATPFLIFLKSMLVVSIFFVIIDRARRVWGVLACLLLTLYQSLIRSFGYINHAELPLLYAAYLWLLFDLLPNEDKKKPAATFIAVTLVFCFTYTLTGVYRLVHGGWSVFAEHNIRFWILENANRASLTMHHADRWIMEFPFVVKILAAGFPFITVFEILAPCCLVSRPFRHAFLCLMVPFHVLNWLFMDILFVENLLLFPLLVNVQPWLRPKRVRDRHPVIYFDGVCNLCNGFVDWIIRRDRTDIFRFTSLQGKTARERLGQEIKDERAWSVYLEDEKGVHKRSSAVIRILVALGGVRKLAKILRIVPGPVLDSAYDMIARTRYRVFGKRQTCRVPGQKERNKFLP